MAYGFDRVNPIERWFNTEALRKGRGDLFCEKQCKISKKLAPLDPDTDDMPPDWVIDVLTVRNMSFKGRCKVVLAHAEEIAKAKEANSTQKHKDRKCKNSQHLT